MRVIATAGHVDHGKSTLILALTGTDPDRFPEEKARGLTIDLGFAFTDLAAGTPDQGQELIGFVDVPGHVRFVKNMLAGVGAVEVAMLIVAANEGWMPQTEEHVHILSLLGINHGVIVLTKTGLVDEETLELAELEVIDHLVGTPLQHWPIVNCDALSMRGLDDVREALRAVLADTPRAVDRGRPRLWVDRAFAAKGSGTVVTGTLAFGSLTVHDDVVLEPGRRVARVRALESHHQKFDRIGPGSRVAINLSGIEHNDVVRGDAIVTPGLWPTSSVIDVSLDQLDGVPLGSRATLAVHVGSGEWSARLRRLDDHEHFARLTFETPIALQIGDRLILRSTGRRITIGGATVLDVLPARRTADAIARLALPALERVVTALGWASIGDIERYGGYATATLASDLEHAIAAGSVVQIGESILTAALAAQLSNDIANTVLANHHNHPDERGTAVAAITSIFAIDASQLRALIDAAATSSEPAATNLRPLAPLVIDQTIVRHRDHEGRASDTSEGQRLIAALSSSPFSPPSPAELNIDNKLARRLVREGAIVDLEGVLFTSDVIATAAPIVSVALHERGALTVAEIRDLLGTTRKFVIPIASALDANGVTRRRGDERIAGPRALPAVVPRLGRPKPA